MVSETVDIEAPRRFDQRILATVSNKKTATRLLDLSFVLRDLAQPGMIYPIVVVPDEGENSPALSNGENLMAACVTHAASVEIPVTPVVRIEMNASDGIIRAAKELHTDIVLIGWSREDTVTTRIFGTVRKKMLQECPARLIIARLVRPLNTTRRLLMPLPPHSERRGDIRTLIQEAKRLARQIGADLCVYLSDPAAAPKLRALVDNTTPEMPVAIHEKRDWPAVRQQLFDDVQPDDMTFLPVERRRGAFWTPSLDRLPEVMAQRFPEMNLLAAYPAFVTSYQPVEYEYSNVPGFGAIIPVALEDTPHLDNMLRELAFSVTSWNTEQQKDIYRLLNDSANAYPVEMSPGVALLHAHSTAIDAITLLVGAGREGWLLPGMESPARVVLALISPKNNPPENHLAALAGIARAFYNKSVVARISIAITADEIAAILQDALTTEAND